MAEEKKVRITVVEGVKHVCAWIRTSTWLRLQETKVRTGKSLGELVGEAIEKVYGIQEGQEGSGNGQQA